jgi:hypothetical protein
MSEQTSGFNRIIPSKVPSEFRKIGMEPTQCIFGTKKCGCVVSMLYWLGGRKREPESWIGSVSKSLRLDEQYLWGLTDGWDGTKPWDTTPERRAGIEDGAAAWQACVERGLVQA